MKENTIGDCIGVAWQGPGLPVQEVLRADYVGATPFISVKAYDPAPATRATGVTQAPALEWKAGVDASKHDVYFGTDAQAVADADATTADVYQGRQDATTYTPDALEWDVMYYWRVDEIGDDGTVTTGRVWNFTTADYLIVDDFEDYDEDMDGGTAIFQTWLDGVENGTGSYVGYEVANGGTFSETVIVHTGHQSMPLQYDNSVAPFYSETSRTLETPEDWTVNGVDTLSIYIQGAGGNGTEPLYAALEDAAGNVAMVVHPNPDIAILNVWTPWEIPLSEFGDAGVDLMAIKVVSIGLGDRSAPVAGGAGTVYIDDVHVTKSAPAE